MHLSHLFVFKEFFLYLRELMITQNTMKKLLLFLALTLLSFSSCYKDVIKSDFNLNDTVSINAKQMLTNRAESFSITFDSVKNDSRCPEGVICIWAGNAWAVFNYTKGRNAVFFTLSTLQSLGNDTTIDGYNIKLISLLPYPAVNRQITQDEYVAKLLIRKN